MSDAVVLLSGGLDSATTAAMAKSRGFNLYALTFAYGQRHAIEMEAARRVAGSLGVTRHVIQNIDLRAFGGSSLTSNLDVPLNRGPEEMRSGIPNTYVPARNTILLAYALAYAEAIDAFDIFIGANAVDYSGYPDCRPEFVKKFEELANIATAAAIQSERQYAIHAPLIALSKADIIREGLRLGVDYAQTHSCYAPSEDGAACGLCDSCVLRRKGFEQAGVSDPTRYVR